MWGGMVVGALLRLPACLGCVGLLALLSDAPTCARSLPLPHLLEEGGVNTSRLVRGLRRDHESLRAEGAGHRFGLLGSRLMKEMRGRLFEAL